MNSMEPFDFTEDIFAGIDLGQSETKQLASLEPSIDLQKVLREKKAASKWAWRPFRNPTQPNGAVLHHWTRADESEDYLYSRFDQKLSFHEYTDEQYEKYFNNDPNWTREETNQLFQLCKQFDLRFVIIADRFEGNKTIQELKDRYYSITNKLIELNSSEHELVLLQPYRFEFNKESDAERVRKYENLYKRSKELVEEEVFLLREYKRIEEGLQKHQKDRRKIAKMAQEALNPEKKRKKEEDAMEVEEPVEPAPKPPPKKEKVVVQVSGGNFLRSSQVNVPLPNLSTKIAKKLEDRLLTFGITRPMPTKNIIDSYNELRHDMVALLELQKTN